MTHLIDIIFYSKLNQTNTLNGYCYIEDYLCHYKNNMLHSENGPALQDSSGYKEWWLNDNKYGENNDFNIQSWIYTSKNLSSFKLVV